MKKTISVLTLGAMIAGSSVFASTSLNTQLGNLELKLDRVKTISVLNKKTKEQQNEIEYLSKELKDAQYTLSRTQQQLKADSINIDSLTSNNKTLRDLKAQLEKKSIQTQQYLTSSYNENIIDIQKADKDKFNKVLDKYTSDKKSLENRIADLNKEIQSRNKTIQNLKDKSVFYEDTINALDLTIKSLSTQKGSLENQLTLTQHNTIDEYKKQIDEINKNAENRVDKIKNQYALLSDKNNKKTLAVKESCGKTLLADKRVLRDQLTVLIAKINTYEDNLFQTAKYLTENADKIGSATAKLEKAYKNKKNPFPKKTYIGLIKTNLGLEQQNPSWITIKSQLKEMREGIGILRGLSDSLAKANLNNKSLKEANEPGGILWGLFS